MSDERNVSQRYRELPRDEPPRHLDDAILSAARRAVESRPAPLVVPTGRRRWYFPLAAAAVIVLAVAVTMHVERERPDSETMSGAVYNAVPAPADRARQQVEKQQPAPPPPPARKAEPEQRFTPDPKPQAQAEPAPASPPQPMRDQQAASAAAEDQRTRELARLDSERLAQERATQDSRLEKHRGAASDAAAAKPAPDLMRQQSARRLPALSTFAEQSPEQWLQGIDDLKRQGRHDEAEKQLAEFRKRYPDYRIPEAILKKFEKR